MKRSDFTALKIGLYLFMAPILWISYHALTQTPEELAETGATRGDVIAALAVMWGAVVFYTIVLVILARVFDFGVDVAGKVKKSLK